jgi:multimeric flavodoxin WrbA
MVHKEKTVIHIYSAFEGVKEEGLDTELLQLRDFEIKPCEA